MNWLDIIMIFVVIACFICGLVWMIFAIKEDQTGIGVFGFFIALGLSIFIGACTWLSTDFKSGQTVGEITSVDKNLFGTTAVYIKTTANQEEEYCVESDNLAKEASELIGKKVKITYGKRLGFYSTGKCDDAPIDSITVIEE